MVGRSRPKIFQQVFFLAERGEPIYKVAEGRTDVLSVVDGVLSVVNDVPSVVEADFVGVAVADFLARASCWARTLAKSLKA